MRSQVGRLVCGKKRRRRKKNMKWENSHVFLLKKEGAAVFRGGAVFRYYTVIKA